MQWRGACPLRTRRPALQSWAVLVPEPGRHAKGSPLSQRLSVTLMLLAMKVGKMPTGLPALCQNSRGTKAPQNKVCMSLPAHQLEVPKGILPYHSLSHLSVPVRAPLLSVCLL